MSLDNTRILSTTNETEAQQQYQNEIGNNVLFIALGDTPEIKELVEKADNLAGTGEDLKKVIWAKIPSYIAELIEEHPRSMDLDAVDVNSPDKAYTLSFSKTIRDIIRHDESVLDNFRVFESYVKAEADGNQ